MSSPANRRPVCPRSSTIALLTGLGLSLGLTGCPSAGESDSPLDAGTEAPDLAPRIGTISGTRIRTHITDPAVRSDRAVDLSAATVEAIVPARGGSGFTTYAGSGSSAGQFQVPSVPLGVPYYLHLYSASETPAHLYIYSTESTLDLGQYSGQRADVVSGSAGSAISWGGISGLDTWTATDSLLYYSSDNELYLYGSSSPAVGSTTLSVTQSFVGQPLLSAARGDGLYVLQLHPTATVDGTEVLSVSRSLARPSFDMTNGSTATISSAGTSFSEPPLSSVSFDYRRSQFAALRSQTGPAALLNESGTHALYVCALLGGSSLSYGFYTNSADLLSYSGSGTSDVTLSQVRFGNPFPASYGLFGYAGSTFSSTYTVPGATSGVKVSAAVTYIAPLAAFQSGPVAPPISPVKDLQINGESATTLSSPITTQPVLSWSPPAQGSPSVYLVGVIQLSLKSGTGTAQKLIAQLTTQDTRLAIPPGLLQSGEYYVFRVTARAQSRFDIAHPLRGSIPEYSAATLTAMVTP